MPKYIITISYEVAYEKMKYAEVDAYDVARQIELQERLSETPTVSVEEIHCPESTSPF